MPIGFLRLMPMGIMLGVSKSSLHVLIQILTIVFAMFGFFFGKINSHGVPYLQYIKATYIILPVEHFFFIFFFTQVIGGFVCKISYVIKIFVVERDRFETIGPVK